MGSEYKIIGNSLDMPHHFEIGDIVIRVGKTEYDCRKIATEDVWYYKKDGLGQYVCDDDVELIGDINMEFEIDDVVKITELDKYDKDFGLVEVGLTGIISGKIASDYYEIKFRDGSLYEVYGTQIEKVELEEDGLEVGDYVSIIQVDSVDRMNGLEDGEVVEIISLIEDGILEIKTKHEGRHILFESQLEKVEGPKEDEIENEFSPYDELFEIYDGMRKAGFTRNETFEFLIKLTGIERGDF